MSSERGLHLLLDAYWWVSGAASGRNVLTSLVATWSSHHPDDTLTLAVRPHERAMISDELARSGIRAEMIEYPRLARFQALAAWSLGRRASGFDAVLTQNFATRSRDTLSCVLVHDAMYVEHPEWFSIPERAYLSMLRPSLRAADVICTTSHAETARIARVWPETLSRLHPVGLGVPIGLTEAASRRPDSIRDDKPFILVVGRLNIRKNLRRLLDAFVGDASLSSAYRLVVVGEPDGKLDPSATASEENSVSFLDGIGDAELRWLYAHCALFVFPSLDEGFGLPLIEAHAMGARVSASDIPPFRELGGVQEYFDPHSPADIARAMSAALTHPSPAASGESHSWQPVVDGIREVIVASARSRSAVAASASDPR
jgi:glycosyltransferase involved in cell wall biosynthesis